MRSRPLDIVFVSPGNHRAIYQGLAGTHAALEPPVWAGLLAQALRRQGYGVTVIDQEGEGLTVDQVATRAMGLAPRLIAVVVYGQQPSASTQTMTAAQEVCTRVRAGAYDGRVIVVGGHPSALPAQTLEDTETDFVCQGEGLTTLLGLLQVWDLDDAARLRSVPGLWFRENGRVITTAPAATVPETDLARVLPGMAWDLLPMAAYRAHNWHCFDHIRERQPYASLYTSLGCPYRCSFCCINAPFGKPSLRLWSPDFVITELDLLASVYGVKNLKIADEMFVLNERHVSRLCDLIIERGHRFNIWAYARVDSVPDHLLEKLKRAGFNWLCLGIESKSRYVRDGVRKGRYGEQEIVDVVRRIKGAGIHVMGNYIFGLPDDDEASMHETLDLAIELNCEMANFYSAMAYPGSPLYDLAVKEGWPLPERWHHYSQHAYETLPLPTRHLSGGEVLAFRDWAWPQYFTNPGYLSLVRSTFGQRVVDHLQELTAITLPRRHAVPRQWELRRAVHV
jgi:radical SAM superfamily enzyme YgiQ (UPF0313 family)